MTWKYSIPIHGPGVESFCLHDPCRLLARLWLHLARAYQHIDLHHLTEELNRTATVWKQQSCDFLLGVKYEQMDLRNWLPCQPPDKPASFLKWRRSFDHRQAATAASGREGGFGSNCVGPQQVSDLHLELLLVKGVCMWISTNMRKEYIGKEAGWQTNRGRGKARIEVTGVGTYSERKYSYEIPTYLHIDR